LINATSAGIGAIASFGLLLVLARGTALDTAGLFFQTLALASAGALVSTFGASAGVTRAVARVARHAGHDASAEIWSALLPLSVASLVLGVTGTVAAAPIASILTDSQHEHELTMMLLTAMASIPLMALTRFMCALARAVDDPLVGGLYDLAGQPLLRVVAAALAVSSGGSGVALGLVLTGPAAVSLAGAWTQTRRTFHRAGIQWSPRPVWRSATAASFWRFAAPRGLEEIVQAANVWLLTLLVGALASPEQAAAYAAITRWTMATTLILQSVTTALLPRLSAAFHRGNVREAERLFQVTTSWVVVASTPICLALLLFPDALLSIVSPDLPDASLGLRILALGSMVNVVTGPVGGVILMTGRSTLNLVAALVAVVAMLVPAVPLINSLGASGAALAWALSLASQNLVLLMYGIHRLNMAPWSRLSVPATLVGVAVVALPMIAVLGLLGDTLIGLLLAAGVGAAVAAVATLRGARPSSSFA
jgi:O-antigen/teichoic acid export membrane protein